MTGAIDRFDGVVTDTTIFLRPPSAAASPIVVVAIDDATLEEQGPLPWARDRLARLTDAAWNADVSGVVLDLVLPETDRPSGDENLANALARGPSVVSVAPLPGGQFMEPSTRLAASASLAHASGEVDADGVVRRIVSTRDDGRAVFPALSLAAALLVDPGIPVEPGRWIRPGFVLPPDQVPRVRASDLMRGSVSPTLEGKVVLLGITATGATDQLVVSAPRTRGPRPGVLIHASAAHSILAGSLLAEAPGWMTLLLCWLLAAAAWWIRERSGGLALRELLVAGLAILAISVVALWGFDLVLPAATLFLAFGLSLFLLQSAQSKRVARETGLLLAELLEQQKLEPRNLSPAAESLELARRLQREVARDRDLRRDLLESLDEGVILWGRGGNALLSNRAAETLWGGALDRALLLSAETDDEAAPLLERGGRYLRIQGHEVPGGHLTVLRDQTAPRALEERKREMQRMVSHELKSPLASIAGFGSMLQRYSLSESETQRVASLVEGEADRLLAMVTTFLDLERLGAHDPGDRRAVDLADRARGRIELLEVVAAEKEQRLTLADGSSKAEILAMPELVDRLLDNLIGNALKYSDEGSEIEIRIEVESEEVALRVRDRGPGIPEEALPRLFDRFYRVPGSSSPGTGLGLALVREIAEWHGAYVEVESRVNEGSTFTVRFPALRERATET